MKNCTKIIIILTVTSFFSAHPMEVEPDYYKINPFKLKGVNPLYFTNFRTKCKLLLWEKENVSEVVPYDHPLYKDRGLALMLTALKVYESIKNEKTLKTVRDAVCDGIPVMSYFVSNAGRFASHFCVSHSENPTSIFTSVEDLFENLLLGPSDNEKIHRKREWIEAVFQGHCERQEECDRKRDNLINYMCSLGTEVPEVLASLIVSYLSEYHVDEKETALINQAKKQSDEAKQKFDRHKSGNLGTTTFLKKHK